MESDKEDTPTRSSEHIALARESESSSSVVMSSNKFNPFKPKDMATAVTLFKHRWLHTFAPYSINSISQENHHKESPEDLGPDYSKVAYTILYYPSLHAHLIDVLKMCKICHLLA